MNGPSVRTPVWQVALVLLGAPALEALLFVASGVPFETFSRFTFIWGAPTEGAFGAMHWWGGPAHVVAASIMVLVFGRRQTCSGHWHKYQRQS